ncbi:MAG: diaminopimelate decarboxylase [Candidatus Eisenbacteria bacterium]|nr:diaminopimelate decarboxylase [Candidatus Eisenbacteria bacterium]
MSANRGPRAGSEGATRAPDLAGVPLSAVLPALQRIEPHARACWAYDLDALERRARRFQSAFAALSPLVAYALKANVLPALIERARGAGLGAESGSIGELVIAARAGFGAAARVLNGNGRTLEEAAWAAREGVALVNADSIAELDVLQSAAAREGSTLRVALRVNPGIETPGHRYVSTGGEQAKFGIAAGDALEAWAARARWPQLALDGVHLHVGSQLAEPAPLARSLEVAVELAEESARRAAPLSLVNLGGGFGVDYGAGAEFPLEAWARRLAERTRRLNFSWVLEPGRWMVAPVGVLIAEVLWVKRRGDRSFVVLAAGMNDLIRPALYRAAHRIVPLEPREGAPERVTVVGPVCESADVFAEDVVLPPLRRGDAVALLDAGAYGASMSSNYNGRGRLAEVVASAGRLRRARAGETAEDLARRDTDDALPPGPVT